MIKLIAYDICQASRLKRVAKLCELYGIRIEKSVFECDLPAATFESFWKELTGIVDVNEDSVVVYSICKECAKNTVSYGVVKRPPRRNCYIAGI